MNICHESRLPSSFSKIFKIMFIGLPLQTRYNDYCFMSEVQLVWSVAIFICILYVMFLYICIQHCLMFHSGGISHFDIHGIWIIPVFDYVEVWRRPIKTNLEMVLRVCLVFWMYHVITRYILIRILTGILKTFWCQIKYV